MRRTTFAAVTLVFLLLPTMANADGFKVRGAGSVTCGAWVKSEGSKRAVLMAWVLGFVTGMNVLKSATQPDGGNVDVLNGADVDAIEVWITNYCNENPLKQVWNASVDLVIEASK